MSKIFLWSINFITNKAFSTCACSEIILMELWVEWIKLVAIVA